jgi:nicotinate-nucleotide adenylyltransferase
MRLALYGGTFDPIHHGHLILARDAIEQLGADRLIFIPAALSPHKLDRIPSSPELRREMLAAAIAGEPRFSIDDRELHRAPPSYTFHTVAELHDENPGAEILYLIGHDNAAALETWHRFPELEKLVRFVILHRAGETAPGGPEGLARRLDLSSTEIRDRIARGLSIRYLVPEPLRVFIEQHQLYRRERSPA